MKIKMYQVDAFTDKLFGGNPAAVCLLTEWLDEKVMQSIATENNLAETAFLVKQDGGYLIRWFTPVVEVDLCGHATLAAAHVVYTYGDHAGKEIIFESPRSGTLKVTKQDDDLLTLNFPADVFEATETPPDLAKGLGMQPVETFRGRTDLMAILSSEEEVANLQPHLAILEALECRGVIVTAKGNTVDFVSRFFAPQSGVDEDPVTGSAHTTLTPYWANVLKKNELTAMQISQRKGYLTCKYLGSRVEISGYAVTYLEGEIGVN